MSMDNGMDVSPSWQELKDERDALSAKVAELEAAIKFQASAAKRGMNAAKEHGAHMEAEARRLHAECSPEALESERQANAQLTVENEALAAHVEQLRRVIINATNSGAQIDSGRWVYSIDDSVLDETPATSLTRRDLLKMSEGAESVYVQLRTKAVKDARRAPSNSALCHSYAKEALKESRRLRRQAEGDPS